MWLLAFLQKVTNFQTTLIKDYITYIHIQSANNNKIKVDSIETRVFSSLEFHWPGNQLVRTSEVNRVLIHCVAERVSKTRLAGTSVCFLPCVLQQPATQCQHLYYAALCKTEQTRSHDGFRLILTPSLPKPVKLSG